MSSVGYGGMFPSTTWGRAIIITCALVGAFILSILVAILFDWIELEDNKKEALITVTKRMKAIKVIKFALQLNVLIKKRSNYLIDGSEESIPSKA